MHKSSYNISSFADELVPEHVKVEYPELIEFIKVYALYLERENGAGFFLNQLDHQRDVSLIEDSLLGELQNEIGIAIPRTFEADTRLFYKRLIEFYQSKGTPDAIRAFFRLIYDDNVTIYYPKVDILAPSDGKWSSTDFNNIGHSNIWTLGIDDEGITEVTAKGDNGSYGTVDSIYTITRDGVETICNTCKEIITHIDGACELTNEDATDLMWDHRWFAGTGNSPDDDGITSSTDLFWDHGDVDENVREVDIDAYGNQSMLWKGKNLDWQGDINDTSDWPDGGWQQTQTTERVTSTSIDHTKTYRVSQWVNSKDIAADVSNPNNTYLQINFNGNQHADPDIVYNMAGNLVLNGEFDTDDVGVPIYPYDPDTYDNIPGWDFGGFTLGTGNDFTDVDWAVVQASTEYDNDVGEDILFTAGKSRFELLVYSSGVASEAAKTYYYTQDVPVNGNTLYRFEKPDWTHGGTNGGTDGELLGPSNPPLDYNGNELQPEEFLRVKLYEHLQDGSWLERADWDHTYVWSGGDFTASEGSTEFRIVIEVPPIIDSNTSPGHHTHFIDKFRLYPVVRTNMVTHVLGSNHVDYNNPHSWPYIFGGKLPEAGKWFLVVGHIHGSDLEVGADIAYNEYKHQDSGIYDTAGNKVADISRDWKWLPGAKYARLSSYAYDRGPSDGYEPSEYRTWFMMPRLDEINDNTPSLYQILINSYSILNEGSCAYSSLEWTNAENRVSLKFDTPLQSGDVIKSYRRGVFSNYDGMPDVKKYLQDSYYYQKFSYVLKTGIDTNKWTNNFKRVSHPAGFIFFGEIEVFSYILGAGMPKWQPGSQTASTDKVIFVPLNNYGKDINIISMRIDTEFSIGPETTNRLGPYDHLENIKFKSWAHIGDYGKFTIQDAINKDINIHMGSIVTINEPEEYDEIP